MKNHSGKINPERCPMCDSSHPHLHPAMQFEGEVEICTDDFHLIETNQNGPKTIAAVLEKRARQQMAAPPRAE